MEPQQNSDQAGRGIFLLKGGHKRSQAGNPVYWHLGINAIPSAWRVFTKLIGIQKFIIEPSFLRGQMKNFVKGDIQQAVSLFLMKKQGGAFGDFLNQEIDFNIDNYGF